MTTTNWTVLFLVHASDDRTRKYAGELFRILEMAAQSQKVKVLVLYGTLHASNPAVYKIKVILSELSNQKLFEVKSYGSIDMGDDKELGPIFTDIRTNYPSERFLLFTWDHGSGFGVFKSDPRERGLSLKRGMDPAPQDINAVDYFTNMHSKSRDEQLRREISYPEENFHLGVITSEPIKAVYTRGLRGLTPEEGKKIKTSMLTNDELRRIIKYRSNNDKVDLMIMMNCLMQMIETGYALHDAVEYLVAPQTCIFWAGYDYLSIINKICAEPEIETEALARYAIDTIDNYYKSTPFKKYLSDLVISLVKPEASNDVKEMIDEIADQLSDDLKDGEKEINDVRNSCEDVSKKYVPHSPYHYVDFINYANRLHKASDKFQIDLHKLNTAVEKYVVQVLKGSNYREKDENNIGEVNGFSIYFPPTADKAYDDFYYDWFYKEGRHQTRFADKSSWKKFLIRYFKVEKR